MGFNAGNRGSGVFTGLDAVCPKSGPYEASEGIYSGPRKADAKGGQGGLNRFRGIRRDKRGEEGKSEAPRPKAGASRKGNIVLIVPLDPA
jgi:hypothetical protein